MVSLVLYEVTQKKEKPAIFPEKPGEMTDSSRKIEQSADLFSYNILYIALWIRAFLAGFILPRFHFTENIA